MRKLFTETHGERRGSALGSNSLFISCALQRQARVSYLYKWNKMSSVLKKALACFAPVLVQ